MTHSSLQFEIYQALLSIGIFDDLTGGPNLPDAGKEGLC